MPGMTDEEFAAAWEESKGSPSAMKRLTGISERQVYRRRSKLSAKGVRLPTIEAYGNTNAESIWQDEGWSYKRENRLDMPDGHIVIFSDAHWWPNQDMTPAHAAMLEIIQELKPRAIVANGDIFDGARVSRHAPIGWAKTPTVKEELDICQEHMHEIVMTAPKGCKLYWNVGNHDQRFDKAMVNNSPEYAGVVPRLEEVFSQWSFAWSLMVNKNTMIKHRYNNGIHATYNNTMKSGVNIVTGHLHRLAVTPWADYGGRRWGVDTGTLSNPHGPQFEYGENNPTPHTSGFAVLTYRDGLLLPPELCEVLDGVAYFRGKEV